MIKSSFSMYFESYAPLKKATSTRFILVRKRITHQTCPRLTPLLTTHRLLYPKVYTVRVRASVSLHRQFVRPVVVIKYGYPFSVSPQLQDPGSQSPGQGPHWPSRGPSYMVHYYTIRVQHLPEASRMAKVTHSHIQLSGAGNSLCRCVQGMLL